MKRLLIALFAAVSVPLAAMVAAASGGSEVATRIDASPTKITICHKTSSDWKSVAADNRLQPSHERAEVPIGEDPSRAHAAHR